MNEHYTVPLPVCVSVFSVPSAPSRCAHTENTAHTCVPRAQDEKQEFVPAFNGRAVRYRHPHMPCSSALALTALSAAAQLHRGGTQAFPGGAYSKLPFRAPALTLPVVSLWVRQYTFRIFAMNAVGRSTARCVWRCCASRSAYGPV